MSIIKDLRKEAGELARVLDLEVDTVEAILELAEKKKIAKPEKLFKEMIPKINPKEKYAFTYLEVGQHRYFLLGDALPLGSHLDKKLQDARKKLKKAKKAKDIEAFTQLVALLKLMDELPIKGYGTGVAKYAETQINESTGEKELLLAVKVSSIEVGGKTKKAKLAETVREIDYEPRTKMGELVYLYTEEEDDGDDPVTEQVDEQKKKEAPQVNTTPQVTPQQVKENVQQLLEAFKEIKPGQAYKGLGLIHQMRQWIGELDEVPAAFQKLLQQLERQHQKLKPVLSEQIDVRFDHSLQELDELEVIQDTATLDEIFGTVQKMFEGWKTFVPEEPHPKHDELEALGQEIDWLKYYEQIIVPMRATHETMEEGDEKEALRLEINTLIEEAKAKLEATS